MEELGIADEIGPAPGQGIAKDTISEGGTVGDAGSEEVRGSPMAICTLPASWASSSSLVMAARVRPFTVDATSARSSVIGAPAVGPYP